MNLVLLSTSAIHHPGPRARWMPLARMAQRRGITTALLCLHPDFANLATATQLVDGVSLTHIAQMHIDQHEQPLQGFSLLATALHASIRMARHTIQLRPQTIGICKAQPINGLAALLAHRRTGTPIILDVDDNEHESHQFAHAWQKSLVARIERQLPSWSRSVSVASHWHTQRLIDTGHRHAAHIPNGIDAIPTLPTRLPNLPDRYIAYVGRIACTTHAVDILVDALAHSRSDIPLVIAGSGPDTAVIHHRLSTQVPATRWIWLGQVAPAIAQSVIAHAHATVDPVRDTPAAAARYPLKIIESLAHGVAVITSAVGDRATMIGPHGRIVRAGDPHALAHAIDDVIHHPPPLRAQGRAQVAHLTWSQIAPRWLHHHRIVDTRGES